MNNKKYTSVDEYIADQVPAVQEKLHTMQQVIRKAVPLAEECISYSMPAYKQAGVLVYFAAQKKSTSVFTRNHWVYKPLPMNFRSILHQKGPFNFR